MNENLWSLDDDIKIESPIEILKSQIKYLEKMTEKSVSADVVDIKEKHNEFKFAFDIISPYLPYYRFTAFTIKCSPIVYPVVVTYDSNIASELGFNALDARCSTECANAEDFTHVLRDVLGTKYMKQVVAAVKMMACSDVDMN